MVPRSALVDKALANNRKISYNGSWECLPPSKRLGSVVYSEVCNKMDLANTVP